MAGGVRGQKQENEFLNRDQWIFLNKLMSATKMRKCDKITKFNTANTEID